MGLQKDFHGFEVCTCSYGSPMRHPRVYIQGFTGLAQGTPVYLLYLMGFYVLVQKVPPSLSWGFVMGLYETAKC